MKDGKKQVKLRIRRVMIGEVANALIYTLQEHQKRFPLDRTIRKQDLLDQIPGAIDNMRRQQHGCKYVPAIENMEISIADRSFILANWTEIRLTCEGCGYFIIWNPPGEKTGIRLGTIDEYMHQQAELTSVASGFANLHNVRADIIEQFGKHPTDLKVELVVHREK